MVKHFTLQWCIGKALLVPEPDIDFIKNDYVFLDTVYVRHNRRENPERKSQVDDLMEYDHYDDSLFNIWYKLACYPWLRKYVKFGKNALTQLMDKYEVVRRGGSHRGDKFVKKLSDVKVWLGDELKDVGE